MAAKDLGTKYVCFKCGTRFYDLKKASPVCPKCGADQRESPVVKAPASEKRSRAPARPVEPAPAEEVEVEPVALDEADEAEEEAEDAAEDEP
jgi:uncharacterized protein (TIGR02300 family)